MATRPPTIYAREIDWPPSKRPDAAHYWVLDREREKLVECDKEPHLLIPLVKIYEDPYGLRDKIPRKLVEDGSCPLCRSIDVSKTQNVHCSWEKQLTQALIIPFILLVVLRRIPLFGAPPVVQEEEEMVIPLDYEVKNSFTNIAR